MSAPTTETKADKQQQQQHTSNRKRPFPATSRSNVSWKDLPAFCDVAAAVSAPIYAARRLPELQQLWYTTTATTATLQQPKLEPHQSPIPSNNVSSMEIPYLSGGGKPSSRHLRRRITNYASKRRHRFPALESNNASTKRVTTSRREKRRNRQGLQQVHQTWATTKVEEQQNDKTVISTSSLPLAAGAGHTHSSKEEDCTTPFWMTTHLWHAKRFHMLDLWQWKIPILHTNRGTRATLRLVRDGCTLLQDATWKYGQPMVLDVFSSDVAVAFLAPCFPTVSFTKSVLCGMQITEGMMHQTNQFPGGAIGPAKIWMGRCNPKHGSDGDNDETKKNGGCFRVYVWVHPSVRPKAIACLQDWTRKATTMDVVIQEPSSGVSNSPKACLQLRGKSATATLAHLQLLSASCGRSGSTLWDWSKLSSCPNLHEMLPHGSVVFVQQKQQKQGTNQDEETVKAISDNDVDDMNKSPVVSSNQRDYADEIKGMQMNWESSCDENIRAFDMGCLKSDDIMLVSQCPRNPNLAQNAGCCGWDVWMDPQKISTIFLTLVLQGKACAIGLLDEAQLRLECEPPLPVFPRDYPDTDEGIQYWQNSDREWRLVRTCLEGGWGRVNVGSLKKSKGDVDREAIINWNDVAVDSLVENMEESTIETTTAVAAATNCLSSKVVVMRGAQFGQPLLQAIQCCGQLPPVLTTEASKQRKRRRVKARYEHSHTLLNSHDLVESLREMIEGLLQALSLPAVVSCRILIIGRGTLDPGSRIWMRGESHNEDQLIGFVTTGAFSPTRGRCHGFGVIGAARFLRSLLRINSLETGASAGRVVVQPDGSRQVETLVRVLCKKPNGPSVVSHQATISLLLE